MKNILVTGGAGFIGANFVPYFIENNPEYHLVNLDALTYAGNLENVSEVENHDRYTFVQGDIVDGEFIRNLFDKYQFHDVIHFAAESHVDNSISGPEAFIKTKEDAYYYIRRAKRSIDRLNESCFKKSLFALAAIKPVNSPLPAPISNIVSELLSPQASIIFL